MLTRYPSNLNTISRHKAVSDYIYDVDGYAISGDRDTYYLEYINKKNILYPMGFTKINKLDIKIQRKDRYGR